MSDLQRVLRVLNYYYKIGANKESVNKVYHKILRIKYENRN